MIDPATDRSKSTEEFRGDALNFILARAKGFYGKKRVDLKRVVKAFAALVRINFDKRK